MSLLGLFLFIFAVWQMPHRESERCVMILAMLKTGLGQEFGESAMTTQSDTSSLYVLVSSLAGTVVGLAGTWIVVAHSFVQPMVA
jgi:hypothetical protein